MNNKLSELRKPVAWPNGCNETAVDALRYLAEKPRPIYGNSPFNTEHLYMIASEIKRMADQPLYSQEYVSALLSDRDAFEGAALALRDELREVRAELEEKDKRISELERANKSQDDHINQQQDRIDSLEKKNSDLGSALGSTEKLLEDRLEKWQELASNQVIKINELQAKLATPVRLPEPYQTSCGANELYLCPVEVADSIRAAGFTFTVEGDE